MALRSNDRYAPASQLSKTTLTTAHRQFGKFRAETAAIPFTMSNAIKLAIADSRDDVRRPDKASATRVPRLKRTNHHFLLITSWKRLIAFR